MQKEALTHHVQQNVSDFKKEIHAGAREIKILYSNARHRDGVSFYAKRATLPRIQAQCCL